MLDNETRLKLQTVFRPLTTPVGIIQSELLKTNQSIDRKWAILDDYSNAWTFTQWKDFKEGLYAEISYREYLLMLLVQIN